MRWFVASISISLLLFTRPCLAGCLDPPRPPGFPAFLDSLGLAAEAAAEIERADRLWEDAPSVVYREELGLRLIDLGQPEAGLSLLEYHLVTSPHFGEVEQRTLVLGLALAGAGRYPQAVHHLSRLQAFATSPDRQARAARLQCLVHLHAADVRPAEACARAALGPEASRWSAQLQELALDPEGRAWIGGALSAVVPGLGQLTAGHLRDGGGALLVNGAWGLGLVELLQAGATTDATLLVLAVGLRFYAGNVQHGAQAWRDRALERQKAAAHALLGPVAAAP